MPKSSSNIILLIVLLLSGIVIGSVIGQLLSRWLPFMTTGSEAFMELGITNVFQLGRISLHLNLATILGIVLAIIVYRKL